MKNKTSIKKLKFMHHVVHLEEDSLAKEIFNEENRFEFPGLWKECTELMEELDIPIDKVYDSSKGEWKRLVNARVEENNKKELLEQIKSYKKIQFDVLKDEKCEMRPYFKEYSLKDVRTKFAIETKMLHTVKSHFPSENKTRGLKVDPRKQEKFTCLQAYPS